MAKSSSIFVCASCGSESSRWLGRCPECGQWNSFSEETKGTAQARSRTARPGPAQPVALSTILPVEHPRMATGSHELDQVLGGGLVPGAAVLAGGEPGIGKSTLLLQTAGHLAGQDLSVLYVSAEESPAQLAMRARRLGLASSPAQLVPEAEGTAAASPIPDPASLERMGRILILEGGSLSGIQSAISSLRPALVIIDSIQAVHSEELTSTPGSVSQVRECAWFLSEECRRLGCALILAGHVTKDGALAGPKTLEHMVDTVLYFEGQRDRELRLIRCVKNRFGNVNELAVFLMTDSGLREVADPSGIFIDGITPKGPGSIMTAALEGNRVLLAEIQALVTGRVAGNIARTTDGVDTNRVMRIRAILESRLGIDLGDSDTFVNVTGGLAINEPAAELAIAAAITGSLRGRVPDCPVVVMGEIGLLGDLRRIPQADKRVAQAAKLGVRAVVLPEANRRDIETARARGTVSGQGGSGPDLVFASSLAAALDAVFGK